MKFINPEIQEAYDSIPLETKLKVLDKFDMPEEDKEKIKAKWIEYENNRLSRRQDNNNT